MHYCDKSENYTGDGNVLPHSTLFPFLLNILRHHNATENRPAAIYIIEITTVELSIGNRIFPSPINNKYILRLMVMVR